MTVMVDFEREYKAFVNETTGNQKRISVKSALGVYCGLSEEGNLRIAFMSRSSAPKIESTKMLKVTQGEEYVQFLARASQAALVVKNPPVSAGDRVPSLG